MITGTEQVTTRVGKREEVVTICSSESPTPRGTVRQVTVWREEASAARRFGGGMHTFTERSDGKWYGSKAPAFAVRVVRNFTGAEVVA